MLLAGYAAELDRPAVSRHTDTHDTGDDTGDAAGDDDIDDDTSGAKPHGGAKARSRAADDADATTVAASAIYESNSSV